MDKLKPILAQKFWILFGVVLIMPLTGYFMTKGKLAAEIDDRWKKLDNSFTSIPAGTGVPNDSWTEKVNQINEQQKLHNRRANLELWAKQKERMFWPKDIAPIMEKAEYFKDLTQEQKGGQVIFKYPLSYRSQIRALWEIVDPLDDGTNFRDSDKRRKVAFGMSDLQTSKYILTENLQPSFEQIWSAQEDIWLQTELLQAIRRLNANAISQGDAFVKQLGKIVLFGGTKATGDAGASSSPSGGGGDTAMIGFGGGFGGPGKSDSTSGTQSADINLAEEFDAQIESGGGGTGSGPMSSGNSFGLADSGGQPASGSGSTPGVKRYIDFTEGQPYKRRGFSIKLVMDHRKVPDLIAELMNSPFPVEIVRVHQSWYSDLGSGSGGSAPGGGSGFSGFNPMNTGFGDSAAGAATAAPGISEDTGGTGFGGGTGSSPSGTGSAAALADPNLANVAIVGVWTLYLPPPPAADGGQLTPSNSAVSPNGLAATPDNSALPIDSPTAATPADVPVDPSGETKKSEVTEDPNSKSPQAESTETENGKPASENEKPASENASPKAESADKSDSDTN